MLGQLDRLTSMATLASVEIRVLPDRREAAPTWHGFDYREPADGSPPYVTLELLHAPVVVEAPEDVELYRQLWSQLWDAAAYGDDALALIREASRIRA
jgi:hypothetical protein